MRTANVGPHGLSDGPLGRGEGQRGSPRPGPGYAANARNTDDSLFTRCPTTGTFRSAKLPRAVKTRSSI